MTRRRGSEPRAEANEKLCFTVADVPDITTRWEDRDGLPLEKQIGDLMVGMLIAGEHRHRRWLEQQAAWQRQRREEEERAAIRRKEETEQRERERLAAIEKAKLDALLSDAEGWRTANNLRAYIEAACQAASARAETAEFKAWLRWASGEADKLDPIISGRAIESITKRATESEAPGAFD